MHYSIEGFWSTMCTHLSFSGHLMSTAQVESVLVEHKNVAEAAVVAAPHVVKGECLYCFVTPKDGCKVKSYNIPSLLDIDV